MRRQRNLRILPSRSHVKVFNISSLAVSSKPASSNRHALDHSRTESRPARSSLHFRTPNSSKTTLLRNFQTQPTSTDNKDDTSELKDPGIKSNTVSTSNQKFHKPKNGVSYRSSLLRLEASRAEDPDVRDRTILLTPWKGTPTILHALGFIQELEEKYGKIWWAGLTKEKANPYEYNSVLLVIFEDAASLSRIPGFTIPSPPELLPPLKPPEYSGSNASLNSNVVDLGPSPSLDPLSNPHTQAMLKHVEAKSMRNKVAAPLFVPWSERLNVSAYQQGGPALEDILAFLSSKKKEERAAGNGSRTGEHLSNALTIEGLEERAKLVQKASWEEFDEVVNIDAVLRKYDNGKLYLPSPITVSASKLAQKPLYFRQSVRLSVARAMVDFGGFSEKQVPSMAKVVDIWQKELDERQGMLWVPWNESASDSLEVAEEKEEKEVDAFDPLDIDHQFELDDLTTGVWPLVSLDSDSLVEGGEDLVPKNQQYQRITNDDDGEEDEWEEVGPHPLQFPRGLVSDPQPDSPPVDLANAVRSQLSALPDVLDRLSQTGPLAKTSNDPAILGQLKKAMAGSDNDLSSRPQRPRPREDLQDPWRTDPRPFRSGLGRDEPLDIYSSSMDSNYMGSTPSGDTQRTQGPSSLAARDRRALINGSHSTRSEGWDKDRRGRKLRSREEVEMLKEFGLGNIDELAAAQVERLRAARTRGEYGKRESWRSREEGERDSNVETNAARISVIADKEQRMKEVKNLKDRLRAILDGTKVD